MKALVSLILGALLVGSAMPPKEAKGTFEGYYEMVKGGFNESMSIELSPDGSYILDHELIACVIGPNGEMSSAYSREEGTWKFEGRVILLEPKAQTKDFPNASVFVPSLTQRLLPRMDEANRLLVNADYPEKFVMMKTKKPNQSRYIISGSPSPSEVDIKRSTTP